MFNLKTVLDRRGLKDFIKNQYKQQTQERTLLGLYRFAIVFPFAAIQRTAAPTQDTSYIPPLL